MKKQLPNDFFPILGYLIKHFLELNILIEAKFMLRSGFITLNHHPIPAAH